MFQKKKKKKKKNQNLVQIKETEMNDIKCTKRKQREGEDKNDRNLKRQVISRVPNLSKTPDQVLKFIILQQQCILDKKDGIIKKQQEQIEEYKKDIENSEMQWCSVGQHYTEYDTGYGCDICGKEMCMGCLENSHECECECDLE